MTKLTTEQFLTVLHRSRLLDEDQYKSVVSEAQHKKLSPTELTTELISKNLITPWQTKKLLAKKYKGFFLGNYRLLKHIGTGGMSRIYLANHVKIQRQVAIKVLPPTKRTDQAYIDRFQREARAAAKLHHPNIVRAYDVDLDNDLHFLVMEYVPGENLHEKVKTAGPLPFLTSANYIAQAAKGLHHAHAAGLVHRDVKPSNLLVTDQGVVKLLDLGLALFSGDQPTSETLTNSAHVLGTADYLSPEQARDCHDVDFHADIYSLGCTFYYLICGQPPFSGGSFAQRILKHQIEPAPPIQAWRSDCPMELEVICQKMMQKQPSDRFESCREIELRLENWLESQQPKLANRPKSPSHQLNDLATGDPKRQKLPPKDKDVPKLDDISEISIRTESSIGQFHRPRPRKVAKTPVGFWIAIGILMLFCLGLLIFMIVRLSL